MYDRSGQRKYLNAAERRAFLRAVEQESNLSKKTFCLTLFYAGCRISEALNLTWNRVDFSESLIIFETLKQRKRVLNRRLLIPPTLVTQLNDLKMNTPSSKIWDMSRTTAWRVIKSFMVLARLEGIKATAKGLRHSFAVNCVVNNVPINLINKWLGHSNLETTAIYLEVHGDEEQMFFKKTWPKSLD